MMLSKHRLWWTVAICLGFWLVMCGDAHAAELRNDAYTIKSQGPNKVLLTRRDGGGWPLEMTFCVFYSEKNPGARISRGDVGVKYNTLSWTRRRTKGEKSPATTRPAVEKTDFTLLGDGFDPRVMKASLTARTDNLFHAAAQVSVTAQKMVANAGALVYVYPEHPYFSLKATLKLPPKEAHAVLQYEFTPKRAGYYSIGYLGAAAYKLDDVDEIWQPLIWQEKRFPRSSYMTLAFRCPIPTALVTRKGVSLGIVADPEEYPFSPLPLVGNSRFGVAVRNRGGMAQPMIFAPVLGLQGSKMLAGARYIFKLRPVIVKGDTTVAFEHIARSLYGFSDYRSNALGSLNRTLENMIDYGMSHWSRFLEKEKGCSYATDAPGAVKNVSSLHPLEMAIVTDNEEIFKRRAYPCLEYMLSRGKFLFTTNRKQRIQSPSYTLDGPCAPISELGALYSIFEKATPAFLELARREYAGRRPRNLNAVEVGKRWHNALALYRATGDKEYLDFAMKGADNYIKTRIDSPQSDFKDPEGGNMIFWSSVAPKFAPLLELYQVTGEKRYLTAAHTAARRFTQFVWMSPSIPDRNILVNKGGVAPKYWYLARYPQMKIPEETAPAWRLSSIGLTSESTSGCAGHRGIFMANYAPWLIRIGHLAKDPFLGEVGRSAIVGRYRNFPGYHINTARTTAYEKADYPLRKHNELSVNSFHYNHIWPMMSMVLDYLVSEAAARSDGAIGFPSEFIEGYGYMQGKFYGAGKGRFYDAGDARLWMPRRLLEIDNVEVNYISARGEKALYLAFMNESDKAVRAKVSLNEKLIPRGRYTMRCRRHGRAAEDGGKTDGTFEVNIASRGLTCVVIDGVAVRPKFQTMVSGLERTDAWKRGFIELDKPAGRAMILNLGKATSAAYVYLKDSRSDFRKVDLAYDVGKGAVTISDTAFPWEFTVSLDGKADRFTFTITGTTPEGNPVRSAKYVLSRQGVTARQTPAK